jgi:hypothetical protein
MPNHIQLPAGSGKTAFGVLPVQACDTCGLVALSFAYSIIAAYHCPQDGSLADCSVDTVQYLY